MTEHLRDLVARAIQGEWKQTFDVDGNGNGEVFSHDAKSNMHVALAGDRYDHDAALIVRLASMRDLLVEFEAAGKALEARVFTDEVGPVELRWNAAVDRLLAAIRGT